MQMMFILHRKHTYGPPRPVTGIALLSGIIFGGIYVET
jgi:hypothetical protein